MSRILLLVFVICASGQAGSLRLATFNAYLMPDLSPFGYPLKLSPENTFRRRQLCLALKNQFRRGLDLVLLQEIWEPRSRAELAHCGYPHVLDLDRPKALIDSGLLILSRWPMGAGKRVRYSENGYPAKVGEDGEFFAKKSFYSVEVRTPSGPITVVTTHLVSFYANPDRYQKQRDLQMNELARHLNSLSGPWVVGGDFNFQTGSAQWDRWRQWVPSRVPPNLPPCTVCGDNSLTDQGHGQLDHLFASPDTRFTAGQLFLDGHLTQPSGKPMPYSDHYGWAGEWHYQ